jgi:hypothetical protein
MPKSKVIAALCSIILVCFLPSAAPAFFYHAAPKAVARRIIAKGVNPAKFNGQSRYGRMFYGAKRPSTALAEKGQQSAVIRMKTSKQLARNSWDLRKPTPESLRKLTGNADMRGSVKRGVIGPKLGQKIGKQASKKEKAILYRSAKNGGTNIAIPASLMAKHPRTLSQMTIYRR